MSRRTSCPESELLKKQKNFTMVSIFPLFLSVPPPPISFCPSTLPWNRQCRTISKEKNQSLAPFVLTQTLGHLGKRVILLLGVGFFSAKDLWNFRKKKSNSCNVLEDQYLRNSCFAFSESTWMVLFCSTHWLNTKSKKCYWLCVFSQVCLERKLSFKGVLAWKLKDGLLIVEIQEKGSK